MNILGLHIGHDASACLIKDNRLIRMIEKERLSGNKYDYGCSDEMIDYVLGDTKIDDIDCVTVSVKPSKADCLAMMKDGKKYRNDPRELNPWECEEFEIILKGVKLPAYQVQHHLAHIASSYYLSNLDSATGLSYDASYWPENQVSYTAKCLDNKIYAEGCPNLNAGILYDQITRCIFGDWQQAGKTMGLAAYGLNIAKYDGYQNVRDVNGTMMLISGLVYYSQSNEELAASAQFYLECDVARTLHAIGTGGNICVSGGTALNVVANKMYMDCHDNVFIAPFCKDSGQSVGGALYVLHHVLEQPLERYTTAEVAFLGNDVLGFTSDDQLEQVANCIVHNGIIFWHQGASEQGPRALTHRSIFARADSLDIKVKVSEKLKGRESFRPLAPIVKAERVSDFFDVEHCPMTEFMLLNAKVLDDRLVGVTHVDGTARVQTISKEFNPIVWQLLDIMEQRTGIPVLINTSLNLTGQPIYETPEQTLLSFKDNELVDMAWVNGVIHEK